jgi:hypothetical protein
MSFFEDTSYHYYESILKETSQFHDSKQIYNLFFEHLSCLYLEALCSNNCDYMPSDDEIVK